MCDTWKLFFYINIGTFFGMITVMVLGEIFCPLFIKECKKMWREDCLEIKDEDNDDDEETYV